VAATTLASTSAESGGMRERRVLSRAKPVTPSARNRSCHRQTEVLLVPDRRVSYHGAAAIGSQQNDLRPPNVFLRAIAVRHDGDQRPAVGFSEVNFGGFAHPPDSHGQVDDGILNRM
jgi:hypothetical protein